MALAKLEYMRRHLSALYTYDGDRRVVGCNQFDGGAVPRFHLARTDEGGFCVFRRDVPVRVMASIQDYVSKEPPPDDPRAVPVYQQEYLALLADHAPVDAIWHGPAYRFTNTGVGGRPGVVDVDAANCSLLETHMADWLIDVPHRRPFKALVMDGAAVAVCASVRITPSAHEAGVATAPSYRRRGCATSVVSAWAEAVSCTNAVPLYSTSWDNVGSQAVARSLGLALIGTDFHIR